MRAVIAKQPGGVEVLEIVERPRPTPGPSQLLVRNFASALNRADLLQRRGLYPPPPGDSDVFGLEFAGEVAEAGSEARGFRRGDRVFGLAGGGDAGSRSTTASRSRHALYDAAAAVPRPLHRERARCSRWAACKEVALARRQSGVGSAAISWRGRQARRSSHGGNGRKVALCLSSAARAVNHREAFRDRRAGRRLIVDPWALSGSGTPARCAGAGGFDRRRLVGAPVSADLAVILHRRLR
jgi:hypothetical protein